MERTSLSKTKHKVVSRAWRTMGKFQLGQDLFSEGFNKIFQVLLAHSWIFTHVTANTSTFDITSYKHFLTMNREEFPIQEV
jgi:hypothetical protein